MVTAWFLNISDAQLNNELPYRLTNRYQLLTTGLQFEKRESPSSVNNAKIVDDILTFDFTTPLGSIYVRRTDVKAFLRDGKLIVVWISALTTFWEGEYGTKLALIKDSFRLDDIKRRPEI